MKTKKYLAGFKFLILVGLVFINTSCADKPCRDMKATTQAVGVPTMNQGKDTVRIFKYDGSLQCGTGKAIAIEEMQKELKDIKVYSAVNKNDGQMRIQLCGSPTGQANIYEIDRENLTKALSLGFKEWIFE